MERWKVWVCLLGMIVLWVELMRLQVWMRFRWFPQFCDGFDRWLARIFRVKH